MNGHWNENLSRRVLKQTWTSRKKRIRKLIDRKIEIKIRNRTKLNVEKVVIPKTSKIFQVDHHVSWEEEGWGEGAKRIFEKIIAENVSKLMNTMNLQTQESQQTPDRIN
jgi:hypothetical protein